MKKYIHAGAMAILMFIVAAMSVACDSKDEPGIRPILVSFSWNDPNYDSYEDHLDRYTDKKKLVAEYSKKKRQLSITFENMCIYARSRYKGLFISESNSIGIGFSVPYVDGLVESPTHKDLKWIIEVPCSGKYSIGIYYMGLNSIIFPSAQFRNGLLLTTLELDLDSDFTRTFKVEMPYNQF